MSAENARQQLQQLLAEVEKLVAQCEAAASSSGSAEAQGPSEQSATKAARECQPSAGPGGGWWWHEGDVPLGVLGSLGSQLRYKGIGGAGGEEPHSRRLIERDWVCQVLETRDNDLRGHKTAWTYHTIALEMDRWLFGDDGFETAVRNRERPARTNVNWFAFATWATATISRNIRLREPPARIERGVTGGFRRAATSVVVGVKAGNDQGVSRSLAWGQRAVFASTALLWVALRDRLGDGAFGRKDIVDAVDDVGDRIGGDLEKITRYEGQASISKDRHLGPLERAFEAYATARVLHQLPARSGLTQDERDHLDVLVRRCILFANLSITAVEQDVVDRAVTATVEHLPNILVRSLSTHAARLAYLTTGVPEAVAAFQLPFRYEHGIKLLENAWARLMTDEIFVMALPTETLRLGRDIRPRRPGRPMYPPALRQVRLAEPEEPTLEANASEHHGAVQSFLGELDGMMSSFDRSRGPGRGTAAWDWRRYDERMNWATSLLRSRQDDPTLFWCPYTEDDEARIVRNQMPERSGDPSRLDVQARLDPGNEPDPEGGW